MRAYLLLAAKLLAAFSVIFLSAVFLRMIFKASSVEADSLLFYPDFCLGGWEKPQNASKVADLGEKSQESEFTQENSSFLSSQVASQIFCGYFPIEEKEALPKSISVSFSWMMKNVRFTNDENNVSSEKKPEEVIVDDSIVSDQTPEVDKVNNIPESTTPQDAEVNIKPDQIEKTEEISVPVDQPKQETQLQSFLNIFANKVFAQEEFYGKEFIDVSYSTDGVRWISIGKVNAYNYKTWKGNIPVSSWEDLKKIQIMLNVIPFVDEKPDIYLDAMIISVEYDRPFVEAASDSLESTASAVVSVLDNVGEKIVSIVQVMEPEKQIQKEETQAPVVIREKKLIFEVVGESTASMTSLPWYSDDFRDKVKNLGPFSNIPDIKSGDSGKSMIISGECRDVYFVVLLWKKLYDYIERPGSFASNYADLCINGRFSYDLKSISNDTQDGEYYLLVAEEDESNPWVPRSALIPIKISSVVEEKTVNE